MDKARQASSTTQKPLDALRCLVCGMPDSKPVEDTLVALGAKVVSQHHRSQIPPDVVISDRAGARRLQNVLGWHQAIPVVTSEWAAVCKRTLQRVPYSEYALPALKDCSVSFTNLDRRDREALKGRVEELGGTVCPDMSKSCTHLVVGNENKASMKRQAAHEWQIPVVSVAWLTETLEKRSVIPIASYRLQSSSEPANTSCTAATDCTNASARQESLRSGANATSLSNDPATDAVQPPGKQQNHVQAKAAGRRRDVDMADCPGSAGQGDACRGGDPRYPLPQTQAGVLEHLQFYVSDMSPGEHAECSEIIKQLRGSKRTTLGAYVTHIIVDEDVCQSQEKRTILEFLEQSASVCTVVAPSWLHACAQASTLLDPSPYCVHTEQWKGQSSATQGMSQAGTVMSGCKLCLDALEDEAERRQAREYIRTLGGQVITAESLKLVRNWDKVFAVCPDSLPPSTIQELKRRNPCFARVDAANMVNMFWVKQCRVAKQLYEAKKTFLFHPIPHKLPIAGFTSVCILMTGFGDGVRLAIVHTMKALGGTCLETVATDQWSHVTHLVCDDSEGTKEGTKYTMCRKKKIPIVGLKWLGACVTSGKVQPHDAYAIKPKAGACTQTQPIPDKVGPSQRVFAGTQGGFGMIGADRPLQRRGSNRTQTATASLQANHVLQNNNSFPGGSMQRGDSLLMELSQGLSAPAAPSGPPSTGPYNFSNLRSQVPSAMNDVALGNHPERTAQAQVQKENPQSVDFQLSKGPGVDSASVLNRIEQKFGIAGDRARPASAKRKSENTGPEAGAHKRACVHGAMHPCNRCTQEKAQSAPAQGRHPPADTARGGNFFHERSAMALAEVVPGLLPCNTDNLTQPLQLTQCSDPLPHTGAVPAQRQHLSKAVRMRKQKAPPNRATQVTTDEDMDMWSSERRGAEIQATQVSFSQKVDFLATERC